MTANRLVRLAPHQNELAIRRGISNALSFTLSNGYLCDNRQYTSGTSARSQNVCVSCSGEYETRSAPYAAASSSARAADSGQMISIGIREQQPLPLRYLCAGPHRIVFPGPTRRQLIRAHHPHFSQTPRQFV